MHSHRNTGEQYRRSPSTICRRLHSITSTDICIARFHFSRVVFYSTTVALVTEGFCHLLTYLYFGAPQGSTEKSG